MGRAGRAIARPACTAVKYAGLEPGAQQLSCKPAALRAQARSPPPPTGAESSGCLRNARHCLRTDGWSVSLCAARAGHEARAMRGKPGCSLPTFDRAAAILTSRLQRMRRVFCSRLSEAHRRSALGARGVIAQARHMDGSQEQPCAIAGGQGQCEGRQAQRGPSWRAMQSPPGGFAQIGRKSAASPIRAQFQEAFSARSIGNAPNLTTATQKSR